MSGMRSHLFGCACKRHAARAWNRPEHWTTAEVGYLEARFGHTSVAAIAGHLGRTEVGVRIKAKRLGLRMKDAGYTGSEIARLMGVDITTVTKSWIRRAGLRSRRPYRQGPNRVHLVSQRHIEVFIRTRGWWIDWEKVPADSPFHALVQRHRWYGKAQLHRLTGRLTVDDDIRAGLIRARKRGAHWYVPESEIPKIRRLPAEHIAESVWRREQVLRVRRERRRRLAVAS
jgi:hypothetical protein